MAGLPTTEWREAAWSEAEALAEAPLAADWRLAGRVAHTFTHFHLELDIYVAQATQRTELGDWRAVARLGEAALPSLMKKAIHLALDRRTSFAFARRD
jgi:A/G-specific adenine glycosylase